ncbi:hypothetical protein ADEAN_000692600 [Angomonas deanei]|uniref:Uncharacterized protein n=1 Tax=Angomonas deanei TaxID=59799 RepID=A0A7G2CKE5_9TRYP|nr:hypothetical protein ADEAN_000692600 [Angomonas deanei]
MQSALRCLEDYALTCKQTMMTCFLHIQRDELISFFHKAYRIGRRDIITEWHADRFSLKLYHLQYVETIARNKYEEARVRFIFGLLAVEERTWRRVILSNFQTSKDQMGKYIGKKLHASNRPKKQYSDERALIIDEERKREKIMLAEERAFRDFTFGPEVQSDDDD